MNYTKKKAKNHQMKKSLKLLVMILLPKKLDILDTLDLGSINFKIKKKTGVKDRKTDPDSLLLNSITKVIVAKLN